MAPQQHSLFTSGVGTPQGAGTAGTSLDADRYLTESSAKYENLHKEETKALGAM